MSRSSPSTRRSRARAGIVQFQLATADVPLPKVLDGKQPCVATGDAAKKLTAGFDEFRRCFPLYLCYPRVVPDDEVVCLKLYHRDDEPLVRLFLDDAQTAHLEKLWEVQRFISQWPVTEHKNLPLFIGFVTQDGGAEAVKYFESLRPTVQEACRRVVKDVVAADPEQVAALLGLPSRPDRRPLFAEEKDETQATLYAAFREKGDAARRGTARGVMARVLVSPGLPLPHRERRRRARGPAAAPTGNSPRG